MLATCFSNCKTKLQDSSYVPTGRTSTLEFASSFKSGQDEAQAETCRTTYLNAVGHISRLFFSASMIYRFTGRNNVIRRRKPAWYSNKIACVLGLGEE